MSVQTYRPSFVACFAAMSIIRSGPKVVDTVESALAVKNKQARVSGSLEFPWYLPYNILLNNLVADSSYVGINAQHALSCMVPGKKCTRIPDFVIVHTNVARTSSGEKSGISSTILAVVEIKPLTKRITDDHRKKGTEGRNINTFNVKDQSLLQARLALHVSPNQEKVVAMIAVGQFWCFTVYKRDPNTIMPDALPFLVPIASNSVKWKRSGNNLLALVREGSDLSDETDRGCEELKSALKDIIDGRDW